MTYPPVIVVDKTDTPVGLAMLAEVWAKGLYHRIVRIMAEDEEGHVLLQKRSHNMTIFPGCWDNSAAGHVDEGMTYHTAAIQEVSEELGFVPHGLAEMGYFYSQGVYDGRQMNQFQKVYRIIIKGTPVTQDVHEVSDLQWFSINDVRQLVREHPEQVTPGLKNVIERLYQIKGVQREDHSYKTAGKALR